MKQDIAETAGKLTKAQRFWVIQARSPSGGGMWAVRNALARLGLAEPFSGRPTPLAAEVRAHLLAHSHPEKQA